MGLPDVAQNSTRTVLTFLWEDAQGEPVDLTDVTITGCLRSRATGQIRSIDGPIVTSSPPTDGTFTWDLSAADVEEAGTFDVQFVLEDDSESPSLYDYTDVVSWRVIPTICSLT